MIHSYPWYIQDWLLSRARSVLTLEQRGLYREILDILYNNEGIIDPDEDALRRMCQAEKTEWKRSWPAVRNLLDDISGKWSHPKVRDTIEKLERYHSQRRAAGKSGAQRRWGNSSANSSAIAEPIRNDSLPLPLPQARTITRTEPEPSSGDLDFTDRVLSELRERHKRIGYKHPLKTGLIEREWASALSKRPDDLVGQASRINEGHKKACETNTWLGGYIEALEKWIQREGWRDDFPEPEWDGYTVVTEATN